MIFSRTTRSVLLVAFAASLALVGGAAAESKLLVDGVASVKLHNLPPVLRHAVKATLGQDVSAVDSAIRGRMLATMNSSTTDHADCAVLFGGDQDAFAAAFIKATEDSLMGVVVGSLVGYLMCPNQTTSTACSAFNYMGVWKDLCKWNATASPACNINPAQVAKWETLPGFKKHEACTKIAKESDCAANKDCAFGPSMLGDGRECKGSPSVMTEGVSPVMKISLIAQQTCNNKPLAACTGACAKDKDSDGKEECTTSSTASDFPKTELEAVCPSFKGRLIADSNGYVTGISPAASKSVFFAVAVAVAIAALMVAM
jgi:hypothetical protein